ncbi:MAG: DUF4846 domain-containing protein [Ignavibacteria bacterium]|nr:DUF4846 domain-containing protein [Ignavibacteria bacterium]
MTYLRILLIFIVINSGCDKNSGNRSSANEPGNSSDRSNDNLKEDDNNFINPEGKDISSRFLIPTGYKRLNTKEGSFGDYLRNFPLKKDGSKVYYFDGTEKENQDIHEAVLDIDAGDKDLQQCADAIMRLKAEYLYERKEYEDIHFNFTNGFNADYAKWAEGYRIKVSGNKSNWYLTGEKDYSHGTFKNYLEIVFSYAGTLSLSKELVSVNAKDLKIGDIFIFGGSPGHAVLIVDAAVNENNEKIFLLAQSYMPAQDIHVLKNPVNKDLSPWYYLEDSDKLYTPEWTFEKTDLKRFNK